MREWTPNDLIGYSNKSWGICALHAAVELDIFTPLTDRSMTTEEMAETLKCSHRGLEALICAMCSLGLMSRSGNTVSLTPFSRQYLSRRSDDYIGFILLHHRELMPSFVQLDTAVREGRPTRVRGAMTPEDRKSFIMGMYNMASVRADQALRAVDFSGRKRLLDLGGGPGAYAVRFCQAYAGMEAVIFDLPSTKPMAESVVSKQGLADRISFVTGDFFKDDLPGGFDVVWISHILHSSDDAESALLLKKAMGCLNPGGLIASQEFILDDSRDGPVFSAMFGLNMLAGTPGGKVYTPSELKGLLEQAGAINVRQLDMPNDNGSGIVMGEKA